MTQKALDLATLDSRLDAIANEIDGSLAVSLYDYQSGLSWARPGDRWFHAAGTITIAVLFARP